MFLKILETLGLVANPRQVSQHFGLVEIHYGEGQEKEASMLFPERVTVRFPDKQNVEVHCEALPVDNRGHVRGVSHTLIAILGFHEGESQSVAWFQLEQDGVRTPKKVEIKLADLD